MVVPEPLDRLEQAERTLDTAEFEEAAELIYNARETVICGFGGLAGVAESIATHLIRIGMPTRTATETGHRLADRLLLITDTLGEAVRGDVAAVLTAPMSPAGRVHQSGHGPDPLS